MRLTIADDYTEGLKKISGGNPGALRVLMECYQKDFFVGQLILTALDKKGIYDWHIWEVYKDKCGEDLEKFIAEIDPSAVENASKLKGVLT